MPIPFTCREEFKSGLDTYEAGNTYRQHRIPDNEVGALHKAGLITVEGREDNERNPQNVVLVVQDSTNGTANPGV